jgi:hypothetical protein
MDFRLDNLIVLIIYHKNWFDESNLLSNFDYVNQKIIYQNGQS